MEKMEAENKQDKLVQIRSASGKTLDLEAVRARLSKAKGPEYWRSLEELTEAPEFREMLEREFPRQAGEWLDEVSRRGFLKLMSASLALAGLTACTKMPTQTIVPYVRQPEEIIPGKPLFFATAMTLGGYAMPLLATSHEGRPTKIEGNPEHPVSRGASDLYAQASVLELYDPDRSQTPTYLGEVRSWTAFVGAMQSFLAAQKAVQGAGFRLLTPSISSPTLAGQVRALQQAYPEMKWHQWEAVNRDGAVGGAQTAFGEYVETRYLVENADVIVTLDANFLYSGFPGFTQYAREWAARRNPDHPRGMARLYAIESSPTTTGFKADHRLPVRASEVEEYARALASRLGIGAGGSIRPQYAAWLDAVAKDLQQHRGACVVIPGEEQPPVVHALAHAINDALGAVGKTVIYTDAVLASPMDQTSSLRELVQDMNAGKVELLLILGCNPVYDAPADAGFAGALGKVAVRIHHGLHQNETSLYCQWHINGTHYLEEWSDTRAIDGTVSVVQPLIMPLYGGHSAHEVLAVFQGQPDATGYDLVRSYWETQFKGADFEAWWRRTVHDGFMADTQLPPKSVKLNLAAVTAAAPAAAKAEGLELIFRPDPSVYDGRFTNNGWLQECPKPLTKLTWDNPAFISPATAQKLGISASQDTDVVEIEHRGRKLTIPLWVQAGHPDDCLTLFYGYGRSNSGQAGTGKGFNVFPLRFFDERTFAAGVQLRKTGGTYRVASTQGYQVIEGGSLVRAAALATYKQKPDFAHQHTEAPPREETLYPAYEYPEYAWGMEIDLNSCVGCNACIVACQAENNIAVVGKEQVQRGRHMHWLRVDGYYEGDPSHPRMHFEPVPCMQCEDAPCELVCPVGATVHSSEGLNDMVYNRCVGTRYCSNNCPWKVRRFNFLLFQDWTTPQTKLVRNPEVTVRSRGVMEKCTYCVQRITKHRIAAEEQERRVQDGEILTACQQACPAKAIVFGDINDAGSAVRKLKQQARNFGLLEELNTRPRTTYLAEVWNPNPEMPAVEGQPEQHY
jgi:MoCo/4Fe-4S cofactor protein with predicted Tat translocation signal